MERPVALLGNHPSCDVRVGGSHGPAVAYVVAAFPDAVEVWPLDAVAFPRWGVIHSHHELLVGSHRISIEHPAATPGGTLPPDLPELAISTMLVWDRQPRAKVFRRRVTIIGESHPSVMRLHDRGLRACDHAAIVHQRSLWLLDLNPDRWGNSRRAPMVKLDTSGDTAQVGGATIRFVAAIAQQSLPPEVALLSRSGSAPGAGSIHLGHLDSSVAAGKGSAPNHDDVTGNDAEIDAGSDADLLETVQLNATAGLQSSTSAVSDVGRDAVATPDTDVAVAAGARSDQLTARVTQRLVSINQHRFLRRRAPWVLASAIVFAIAVWLLVRLGRTLFNIWFGEAG